MARACAGTLLGAVSQADMLSSQQPPQKLLCCAAIREAVALAANLPLMRHLVSPVPPPPPQQDIPRPPLSEERPVSSGTSA